MTTTTKIDTAFQPTTVTTFVDTVRDEDDIDLGPLTLEELPEGAKEKYFEAIGRRKTAVARVRLMTRKSGDKLTEDAALMTVNDKDYAEYFLDKNLILRVEQPLRRLKSLQRFKVTAKVNGGGISGQADAVRHGISRALELFDANFRKKLKKAGFLTRDPRKVERKKPGLKKARKGPRWAKR
jgi:small subunit ribosomal protein S9